MGFVKGFLVFVVVLILLIVGAVTYFGFMPVLSSIAGTDKPRDLGVKFTEAEFQSFVRKAGSELVEIPEASDAKTVRYEGSVPLAATLSGEEISARINYSPWVFMPIRNVQVRINTDGTVEGSGTLATNRVAGFLAQVGGVSVSREDVTKGLSALGVVSDNPPVYIKGTGSARDNKAKITITRAEIGRIPVPIGSIGGNGIVTQLANAIISQAEGLYVKTASFEGGKFTFDGAVPGKLYSVHAK